MYILTKNISKIFNTFAFEILFLKSNNWWKSENLFQEFSAVNCGVGPLIRAHRYSLRTLERYTLEKQYS